MLFKGSKDAIGVYSIGLLSINSNYRQFIDLLKNLDLVAKNPKAN